MTDGQLSPVVRHVRTLADADPTDGLLLGRFVEGGDQAAFAALVRRYGSLVFGVCRRVLHDRHAAEDACQATFLVLARRAAALDRRGSLAGWLHTVASRLARRTLAGTVRQRQGELQAPERRPSDPLDTLSARELCGLLDEELARLPEKYRTPLVLCCLDGRTRDEAARLLGWSVGRVKANLERGRVRLRDRLARRGVALASLLLAAEAMRAEAPAATVAVALGTTPPRAAVAALAQSSLTEGMGRRFFASLLTVLLLAAGGVAVWATRGDDIPSPAQAAPVADDDPLPRGALRRLGTLRLRAGGMPLDLRFSADGATLLSGHEKRTLSLWDVATGREKSSWTVAEGAAMALAVSPDGTTFAAALQGGGLGLYDVATGKLLRRLGEGGRLAVLAFSADGGLVAGSGSTTFQNSPPTVHVWDVRTGRAVLTKPTTAGADALAFASDARTLAAALGPDKAIALWRIADGVEVLRIAHAEKVRAVAVSPDGRTLATGDEQGAHLWDATTGKEHVALKGHRGDVKSVVFSADGRLVATGGGDHQAIVWDAATGAVRQRFQGHPDRVQKVAFSPDGRRLASCSAESALRLWDIATGKPLLLGDGHEERVPAVAYSGDGRLILSAGWDGTARLWDAATGRELRTLRAAERGAAKGPLCVARLGGAALSPDGRFAGAVREDDTIVLWETTTGRELRRIDGHSFAFSPDGRLLAVGGRSGNPGENAPVFLTETATGKVVREMHAHPLTVGSVAFSADGTTLMTRGEGHLFRGGGEGEPAVRLWDVATGRERPTPPGRAALDTLTASPDGKTLVTFTFFDKGVTLWEAATGQKRLVLTGHADGGVFRAAFSPDGRTVATAGMDGTARLWDVLSGREVARLEGHRGWVMSLMFAPDGRTLATSSIDTTVLLWDVAAVVGRPRTVAEVPAAALDKAWDHLTGDAAAAREAMAQLVEAKDGVAFLSRRLRPAAAADAATLRRLLADLDADDFATREKATKDLEQIADVARSALVEAMRSGRSAERTKRLREILDKEEAQVPTPETLRTLRAVEVLEHVGTAEARGVLEGLAKGASGARLTTGAKEALGRVAR